MRSRKIQMRSHKTLHLWSRKLMRITRGKMKWPKQQVMYQMKSIARLMTMRIRKKQLRSQKTLQLSSRTLMRITRKRRRRPRQQVMLQLRSQKNAAVVQQNADEDHEEETEAAEA